MALNEKGHEVVSSDPVAVPLKFRRIGQYDNLAELVRTLISRQALEQGRESFEDADDFEVGDDYDPQSFWEEQFDPSGRSNFATNALDPFVQEYPKAAPKTQSGGLSTGGAPSRAEPVDNPGSPDGNGTDSGQP